jgi:predicted nuclease of predicted toxin-antitoxin system
MLFPLRIMTRECRIVITTDRDFEELVWREGSPMPAFCGWKTFLAQNARLS